MSTATDMAVKALQEKVAWLEKELADLRALLVPVETSKPASTLHLKKK